MSSQAHNGPKWRNNAFNRNSMSPTPAPAPTTARPLSMVLSTSAPMLHVSSHSQNQPQSQLDVLSVARPVGISHSRSQSQRNNTPAGGTFAPQFIHTEEAEDAHERVKGIEGENDFSGKRYVWVKDTQAAFVRGWVVNELENDQLLVQCDDGSQREVAADSVDKVNPAKFDKTNDMAELTHLNEPSVVHNLHMRYQSDMIYTYSGLFLVTVNPYCPLPIYTKDYINMYRGRSREDTKPHIFAIADEAFRNLVDEGANQSILVTGESGAGKTENTKKVIQYLAAVAAADAPRHRLGGRNPTNLSEQILRANPILEAFGNAQTVRNNNSSRFGKFIRIEFTRSGQIAGAFIDWYLLEKSRVVKLNASERSYHIFYQLLRGADSKLKREFLLENLDIDDFEYTKHGNDVISGVSDHEEWNTLIEAFHVMGFSEGDQHAILRKIAAILHLGNIRATKESIRADQATLSSSALTHAQIVCRLLGIPCDAFVKALLHPRVKAGREWVEKVQTPEQVNLALDALAKGIYERGFGDLVTRINGQLDRAGGTDDSHFIGVLDIAGFEIFDENSFEQLCINYTNEKLQQFFNHHMFVLEQEEYAREQIEWKFIDFGRDLQPTIDLIELSNPIGIFSCLDEDCVMPKATDKTFTEKLNDLWDRKTPKYRRSIVNQGFILTHYAAEVEYSTEGWLEKNKDPLNDNVTRLLAASADNHIATLFADCADVDDEHGSARNRVKKGLFRTVAQRHKEQLSSLMAQLHSTHPHFVRCILPNHKKRPKQFSTSLVLDQLRCNGVLEGIRIARTGFPNRLSFVEFRNRYEVLCNDMPSGYLEGQAAAKIMLEKLKLDKALYRVGLTKVFFRAGVLAELEEQRDSLIQEIMARFQSIARGHIQRRMAHKRLYRAEATRIIQRNFQVYLDLQANPWWRLFVKMRPMLGATRQAAEVKKRDEMIQRLEETMQKEAGDRQKLDDDRRKAEAEIHRIQQTLESERALALDKEEIFKRLQLREVELSDKLAEALDDQENLEDQIDELMEAKKHIEEQADKWRKELESAGLIIAKLEAEKQDLANQMQELDKQVDDLEAARSKTSEAEESLGQEVRMLSSQLSLKDRKLQDLEAKLLKTDQDLDIKLAAANKDLTSTRKQIKDLLDENRSVRQQINDLSATSTSYEDLIRRKESELAILRTDVKQYESDRKLFDSEKRTLASKHDALQTKLRDAQGEMEALRSRAVHLEREAADAKQLLAEKISEDEKSGQGRKMLEDQIEDLRTELYQVQAALERERQSRDDVEMIGEEKYKDLKRDFDSLNESKITIEKEMYAQQDILRRANEAKASADTDRKEIQRQLHDLRQEYLELKQAQIDANLEAQRTASRLAAERAEVLAQQMEAKDRQIEQLEAERESFIENVEKLKIAASDAIRAQHDQNKQRLERELVTVKGRLTASENDNRALLNKIQQKNLDIARSNSRMGDSQRNQNAQIKAQKEKLDEENRHLHRQLDEAQLSITSLEKQKEKLALSLEDLTHEVTCEHKSSRNAENATSALNLQLAETNRKLETERQLRTQAQGNTRAVQAALDNANKDLSECHAQLIALCKVFDPEADMSITYEKAKPDIANVAELAKQLDSTQQALRIATERYSRAEGQVDELRDRFEGELFEVEGRHNNSRRALLEEMNSSQINQANARQSPMHFRNNSENRRPFSATNTPINQRHLSNATNHSAKSDKTVDSAKYNQHMDLAAQLEEVENRLQMTEMRNRHLENELRRSPTKADWVEESPSLRRQQKLERENSRLHHMLDDSSAQLSALERSARSGQLSLQEIQAQSHEELYDLIRSQEQMRKELSNSCKVAREELTDAKRAFDDIKKAKAHAEAEANEARCEVENLRHDREQESASHSQLLQEFADLQIRMDAETSRLIDVESNLNIYKARADEYFNKLEQAEVAVLKASRAEQFAKSQAREAEETCATIMAERKHMDDAIEDLQRQTQRYEERIEDLTVDLDGAVQAKKRLQNELEDYRNQRAMDLEDNETSVEQTRKTYQNELSALSHELELERQNVIYVREENGRMREEIEELRSKWDDEILNSSTWAKEKARLEMTLQDVSNSRDEATSAHNEAQAKIVSLLSQVNALRSAMDEACAERDNVLTENKTLERRLADASERLEELSRSESPSMRNAASLDKELLQLRSELAQQEDIVSAAVGKMRRSEALASELQKDIGSERELNVQLHREKAALEKSAKDLQLKLVDLETRGLGPRSSQDVRFLHGRVQELEKQLESVENLRATESKSVRAVDRTVKDLQSQVDRREKANVSLTDDLNKARDKISNLLSTIDELQSSDSTAQLAAKRAERELREEREKCLRLERELEGWKSLRVERRSTLGVPGQTPSEAGSRRVSNISTISANAEAAVKERPSTAQGTGTGTIRREPRRVSGTKGFL